MSLQLNRKQLLNLEDQLLKTEQVLYVHADNTDGLNMSLKSLSLQTGWAIYVWNNEKGLLNLKNSEPAPAKTADLKEAIRYSVERKHFAVYVLPVISKEIWLEVKILLSGKPDLNLRSSRYLFIVPKNGRHEYLTKHCEKISLSSGLNGNIVLRDGQWVSTSEYA
ncbi:hypothetical protein [Marinicella sp. W31]|uniref:hypothetical protein n=1 Tax=Marinicella sp. W31 TaxID=3023713 RepID=UPI0037574DB2